MNVVELITTRQRIALCIHYQNGASYHALAAQDDRDHGRLFSARIHQHQAHYHARQAWIRLAHILKI